MSDPTDPSNVAVLHDTSEVRTTSSSGAYKGQKLARFDLIPAGPLRELAEHYGKGAEKYEQVNGRDNWRNGYNWSLSIAALMRHLNSFLLGQDFDPETGSKEMIAVAWHALTIAEWMNHPDIVELFDDRQDTPAANERRIEDLIASQLPGGRPAIDPLPAVVVDTAF